MELIDKDILEWEGKCGSKFLLESESGTIENGGVSKETLHLRLEKIVSQIVKGVV